LKSAVLSGFLVKQGGKRKSWNKRWFVLCPLTDGCHTILYFKDEVQDASMIHDGPIKRDSSGMKSPPFAPAPEGDIPLQLASVQPARDLTGKDFSFIIATPTRNYFLEASSGVEMRKWIETIQGCVECSATQRPFDFSGTLAASSSTE
jgi:hypothetical protein